MMTQERLDKTEEVLFNVLNQIESADFGSKEQMGAAQVYETLNRTLIEEQKLATDHNESEYKKDLDDQEYREEFKEKKWRHKMDIATLAASVAVPTLGLVTVLIAETTNVFTRLASKNIVSKVLNFKK